MITVIILQIYRNVYLAISCNNSLKSYFRYCLSLINELIRKIFKLKSTDFILSDSKKNLVIFVKLEKKYCFLEHNLLEIGYRIISN